MGSAPGTYAGNLLGLTGEQEDELFYDGGLLWARDQQTPSHARKTVAHIRRFQKKYRAQLMAKRIERGAR